MPSETTANAASAFTWRHVGQSHVRQDTGAATGGDTSTRRANKPPVRGQREAGALVSAIATVCAGRSGDRAARLSLEPAALAALASRLTSEGGEPSGFSTSDPHQRPRHKTRVPGGADGLPGFAGRTRFFLGEQWATLSTGDLDTCPQARQRPLAGLLVLGRLQRLGRGAGAALRSDSSVFAAPPPAAGKALFSSLQPRPHLHQLVRQALLGTFRDLGQRA